MRSLFVMDHIASINMQTDSTWMLIIETQRRGWPTFWCQSSDLYLQDDRVLADACSLSLAPEPPFYQSEEAGIVSLDDCDLVWMRKDPPYDKDYLFCTYLLDLAAQRTTVINDPLALKMANEKIYPLRWPQLCPETVVTSDPGRIRSAVDRMGKAVLKPWDGSGGRGVLVTDANDANLNAMAELLTDEGRRAILVQRYLPQVVEGDKRIILVDGEPRGWLNRIPGPDDHRGNIHVGATVEECTLTDRDREICQIIGPDLKSWGMVFVGIDVIGGTLTEINLTSPTGIQEANRFLGVWLEEEIVDAAERRAHLIHGGKP